MRRVPRGRVVTYGQVATLVGQPRGARAVGWALRALGARGVRVPWHRVVGRGGRISLPPALGGDEQRRLLRREGVRFRDGRVAPGHFLFPVRERSPARQSTLTRGSRSVSRAR